VIQTRDANVNRSKYARGRDEDQINDSVRLTPRSGGLIRKLAPIWPSMLVKEDELQDQRQRGDAEEWRMS